MTRRQARELRRIVEGMRLALAEPSLGAETDESVHAVVCRMCPNRVIGTIAEQLIVETRECLDRMAGKRWADPSLTEEWLRHHERIVCGVAEGDPELAQAMVREHLLSVVELVLSVGSESTAERELLRRLEADYGAGSSGGRER